MFTSKPQLPKVETAYDPNSPFPTVKTLYSHPIPTAPGKTIIGFQITFVPKAATPPHTHRGAFISGHVLYGHVLNGMNKAPMELLGPGEAFQEFPGCRHRVSANASQIEEAAIFAVFIVDTSVWEECGPMGMTVIDEEWKEIVEKTQAAKGVEKAIRGNFLVRWWNSRG